MRWERRRLGGGGEPRNGILWRKSEESQNFIHNTTTTQEGKGKFFVGFYCLVTLASYSITPRVLPLLFSSPFGNYKGKKGDTETPVSWST